MSRRLSALVSFLPRFCAVVEGRRCVPPCDPVTFPAHRTLPPPAQEQTRRMGRRAWEVENNCLAEADPACLLGGDASHGRTSGGRVGDRPADEADETPCIPALGGAWWTCGHATWHHGLAVRVRRNRGVLFGHALKGCSKGVGRVFSGDSLRSAPGDGVPLELLSLGCTSVRRALCV